MPTNLDLLPSNEPIRAGRVQIKRGAVNVAPSVTSANNGQKLNDGTGTPIEIYYTPKYACYWVVRGQMMTHGVDGDWRRCDFGILISPADAEGRTLGYQCCMQTYPNSTVEWRTWSGSFMFKLNPGVAYSAYLTWQYSSGYTQQYHTGPQWIRIIGRVVGEGVV